MSANDHTEKFPSLKGKVILITGASRGIGAAAAIRVAQWGGSVVINYHQNRDRALEVFQEIEKGGGKGMVFQADVTQKGQVEEMRKAVEEKFGPVDVLVNNAFFPFEINPISQLSWEGLEEATSKELSAFHNCTQVFIPGMIEKKSGKIIVVSTRLAQQPLPRMGAYAAAKAALEAMANTMSIELGPSGINVNVVTPAFTLTDASKVMPEQFKERVRQSSPSRNTYTPKTWRGRSPFSPAAILICSPAATY